MALGQVGGDAVGLLGAALAAASAVWGFSVSVFGLSWTLLMLVGTLGVIAYSGRLYGPGAALVVAGRLVIALPIGGAYSYLIASLMRFSVAAGAWNEVLGSLFAIGLTGYVALAAANPDAPLRQALVRPALLGCGIIIGCWLWPAVTLSLAALLGWPAS